MLHSVLPKAAIDSMRTKMDWKNALYKEEDFETINMGEEDYVYVCVCPMCCYRA